MAKQYPFGSDFARWVSTQWLEDHLLDGNLQILDCQPDVHDYITEHIPGAIYVSEGLLRAPLRGLPAQYIPPETMQEIVRHVGLRSDVPIVVYTGSGAFRHIGDGLEQTMMAYSLARFGHERVHVLDGGLDKWKQEGRALTKDYPKVQESDFTVHPHPEYWVTYEEFRALKDRDDVIVLDARPTAFYEGQGPWSKPGHIPGAISLPWKSLMADDNPRLLKPDAEIQALLDSRGIIPGKTIICTCGTGREATNEMLLFRCYKGFPQVRIYEGSFTEWCAYPENPTVTGPNPREAVAEAAPGARMGG